jgi:predicted O-methyltransferase YrrM
MPQEIWTRVERYLADLFMPADPVMADVLKRSAEAELPSIEVAPTQGKLLMLLARLTGARRILEIGTLGGYSTIWLARGLPADGRLITLEMLPKHADVARANLETAGLADKVEIRVGPAIRSLAALAAEHAQPFDMIFLDADKESYVDYLAGSLTLSRPGGLIVADNVVRDGAVIDPANRSALVEGVRAFNRALAAEPRLEATAIQTVGSKGYDGFAIALVKA